MCKKLRIKARHIHKDKCSSLNATHLFDIQAGYSAQISYRMAPSKHSSTADTTQEEEHSLSAEAVRVPLIVATEETFRHYGRLVRDFNTEKVTYCPKYAVYNNFRFRNYCLKFYFPFTIIFFNRLYKS